MNTLNLKAEPIVESSDDLKMLNGTRRKYFQNPFFAYYNINSLRFKFNDFKEVLSNSLPDVLVLAETKLDKSFPNAQFFLVNVSNQREQISAVTVEVLLST